MLKQQCQPKPEIPSTVENAEEKNIEGDALEINTVNLTVLTFVVKNIYFFNLNISIYFGNNCSR